MGVVQKGIRVSDARQMMRLVNELRELPNDPVVRKAHLLSRLSEMANAYTALTVTRLVDVGDGDGDGCVGVPVHTGWTGAAELRTLQRYLEAGEPPDPAMQVARAVMRRLWQPFTLTRAQLVGDKAWYASPHVNRVRRALGVDDGLYSLVPLGVSGTFAKIVLNRPWGEGGFGERERQVLHLVHQEVAWIYRSDVTPVDLPDQRLSPRQRQTLQYLLMGMAEKQIAQRMVLSRHTVHVHIKALYRLFGVSSRGELLAKFVRGGGRA